MTLENTGNKNDYVFGCAEGWDAFDVVRFHALEEISTTYAFEIVLLRHADKGPADLDALVDAAASLRIASTSRWRVVHGIVAEAEEIDRTPTIFLYRVLLEPHVARAKHRKRCRNFIDTSLKDILTEVLENRSPAFPNGNQGLALLSGDPTPPTAEPSFDSFSAPTASYRFALQDESRVSDATNSPYVVQYNESDFDFLNRLLEKEGIAYYFEQAEDQVVMTLTDAPGQSPLFSSDASFDLRGVAKGGAAARSQEVVRSLRQAKRLRSNAVTVREYDWHRSKTPFDGAITGGDDADRLGVFEFGAEDENHSAEPGSFPAQIRLQRLAVEAALREGTSTVRTKEPGYGFKVHDADGLRDDADLVLVRVETWAASLFPQGTVLDDEPFGDGAERGSATPFYRNKFVALPSEVPFRPALRTSKRLIAGVQPAVVTAEEFGSSPPEINADKNGSVRLRFPWDQRPAGDNKPSSNWVRVSQLWAGAGYGGLSTPRVGHEVLVAFVGGDPDRPIIVGRVHNPQGTPPYDASTMATRTTIKSQSSPNAAGSNEIRFEDAAGSEEVMIHAQYDMNVIVENNLNITVNNDENTVVHNNQTNNVDVNLTQQVGADESNKVGGNQTVNITGNQGQSVGGNQDNSVSGNQSNTVGGNRTQSVGGNETQSVGGNFGQSVGGTHETKSGGAMSVTVGATLGQTIAGAVSMKAGGGYTLTTPNAGIDAGAIHAIKAGMITNTGTVFIVSAGSATLTMQSGLVVLSNGAGATIALMGPNVVASGALVKAGGSGSVVLKGPGGNVTVDANVSANGGTINLNN
jgi:type VI secretion system secreted protein VgrG